MSKRSCIENRSVARTCSITKTMSTSNGEKGVARTENE